MKAQALFVAMVIAILPQCAMCQDATWSNLVESANRLQDAGKLNEAKQCYFASLKRAEAIKFDLGIATSLAQLGGIEQIQSDDNNACIHFERAVKILKLTNAPADLKATLLSEALSGLAGSLSQQGKFSEAAEKVQEAIDLTKDFDTEESQRTAMSGMTTLAQIRLHQERFDECISIAQRTISMVAKLSQKSDPTELKYKLLQILASAYAQKGDGLNAEKSATEALATMPSGINRVDFSDTCFALSSAYCQKGDLVKARWWINKAISIKTKCLGANDPSLAYGFNALGVIAMREHNFKESRDVFEKALALLKAHKGADPSAVGMVQDNLRILTAATGKQL